MGVNELIDFFSLLIIQFFVYTIDYGIRCHRYSYTCYKPADYRSCRNSERRKRIFWASDNRSTYHRSSLGT